jgi:hypothetical protein
VDPSVRPRLILGIRNFASAIEALIELSDELDPKVQQLDRFESFSRFGELLTTVPPEHNERFRALCERTLLSESDDDIADNAAERTVTERSARSRIGDWIIQVAEEFGTEPWGVQIVYEVVEISRRIPRQPILQDSILVSMISSFEVLFAAMMHAYFAAHPEGIPADEAQFSLTDLKQVESIDDAVQFLIDQKVERLLNGGHEEWFSWFSKTTKLDVGKHAVDWEFLTEGIQRRHVIVHNAARVSRRYLDRVSACEYQIGHRLETDKDYVLRFGNELLVLGLRLAVLLWDKLGPEEGDEALAELSHQIYRFLRLERYPVVVPLTESMMLWEKQDQHRLLVARVNRWVALKQLLGLDEIRSEVESWDTGVLAPQFKMVQACLLDNLDEAFKYLPLVIAGDDVEQGELYDWPALEEMRKDARFLPAFLGPSDTPISEIPEAAEPASTTPPSVDDEGPSSGPAPGSQL